MNKFHVFWVVENFRIQECNSIHIVNTNQRAALSSMIPHLSCVHHASHVCDKLCTAIGILALDVATAIGRFKQLDKRLIAPWTRLEFESHFILSFVVQR
jgi:hypothetical protein